MEARDTGGDFYPLVDRLRHRFAGRPAPGPADVVDFPQHRPPASRPSPSR
nr:hypothetical protein [Streptomyces sp. Sge12]